MNIISKNNLIKRTILSTLILGIFLMPISASFENKNIQINKVSATEEAKAVETTEAVERVVAVTDTEITATISNETTSSITFTIKTKPLDETKLKEYSDFKYLFVLGYKLKPGETYPGPNQKHYQQVKGQKINNLEWKDPATLTPEEIKKQEETIKKETAYNYTLTSLDKGQNYFILFFLTDGNYNPDGNWFQQLATFEQVMTFVNGEPLPATQINFVFEGGNSVLNFVGSSTDTGLDINCSVFNPGGCVSKVFYNLWEASSFFAKLAAKFLDFLIYYSTNSSSYQNAFVKEGWGAVRDIVNIFFIIALLYVAIKLILSLDSSNTKKFITYVVIIALLINFSLFFTQVIIDASNILAKVFYNNIKPEGEGQLVGAKGEKSISIGLVNKFNPQNLVSQEAYEGMSLGRFIFIILLLILITVYTTIIFITIGLVFVSRVVMLWISMIFAPLAFVSYTVPFNIPGFGHKEWWKNLLENAFLAPIFVFLLYIIIMFAGFLSTVTLYQESTDSMQSIMAVIIPFVILFILLKKAKDITIKFSGELGSQIMKLSKGAAMLAGGVALGAVAGGAAIAGRATLGRAGASMANNARLKNMSLNGNWIQRQYASTALGLGKNLQKGNMDIRSAKIGGKSLGSTGLKVNTLGKPKEGGYEKAKADRMEKRIKRAKELEVGPNEKEAKDVRKAEIALDDAKTAASTAERLVTTKRIDQNGIVTDETMNRDMVTLNKDLAFFEKAVTGTERAVADAARELQNAIALNQPPAIIQAKEAALTDAKNRRDINLDNITKCKDAIKDIEIDIKKAEEDLTRAQNIKAKTSKDRQTAYAERLRNNPMNFFTAGGKEGADEAADKIRARSASENKQQQEKK